MSREGEGHPFREPRAPPFTWQNPKVRTQKHLVLALRDGSHQAMSAGPASLSPGVLAVGSRGRQSPDGEQLASKTVCQMWPAGLAGSRLSWTEVTNS